MARSLEDAVGLGEEGGRSLEAAVGVEPEQGSFLGDVGRGIARIPGDIIQGIPSLVRGFGASAETMIPIVSNLLQGKYGEAGRNVAEAAPEMLRGAGQSLSLGAYQPEGESTPAREAGRFMGGLGGFIGATSGLQLGARALAPAAARFAEPLIAPLVAALMGGGAEKLAGGSFTEGATSAAGQAGLAHGMTAATRGLTGKLAQPMVRAAEAQQELGAAESAIARPAADLGVEPVLSKQLGAPVSTQQAYSFIDAIKQSKMPTVTMENLNSAATGLVDRFNSTLKMAQPGFAKTAGAVEEATGGRSASAGPSITNMPGLPKFEAMTPTQLQAWAPVIAEMQKLNSPVGKALPLNHLRDLQQKLGQLIATGDPATSGYAKHLYRNLYDDVRAQATTSPAAASFYRATQIARQNFAAADIADIITKNGTTLDNMGRITVKPGAIAKAIKADELLKDLPPEKARLVVDTLEMVFRAHRNVEAHPAPSGIGGSIRGTLNRAPAAMVGGLAAATVTEGLGLPIPHYYAFAGGSMLGAMLPRGIFRAALTPEGRAMLTSLYRDQAPSVGPGGAATTAALMNFLRAQDAAQAAQGAR